MAGLPLTSVLVCTYAFPELSSVLTASDVMASTLHRNQQHSILQDAMIMLCSSQLAQTRAICNNETFELDRKAAVVNGSIAMTADDGDLQQ